MILPAPIYYGIIAVTILFLLWWRYCCGWYYDEKFPTKGHIVLLGLLSAIPILDIVLLLALIIVYFVHKADDDIYIKSNWFTKYWFDADEEDE